MIDQQQQFYQVASQSYIERSATITIGLKVLRTKASKIYFALVQKHRRVFQHSAMSKGTMAYKLSGGKFLYEDGNNSMLKVPAV